MSYDWTEDKGFFFNEEDYGDDVCPNCGSSNVRPGNKTYENSDRDGNRGVWVRSIYCRECDEEFTYYL